MKKTMQNMFLYGLRFKHGTFGIQDAW